MKRITELNKKWLIKINTLKRDFEIDLTSGEVERMFTMFLNKQDIFINNLAVAYHSIEIIVIQELTYIYEMRVEGKTIEIFVSKKIK